MGLSRFDSRKEIFSDEAIAAIPLLPVHKTMVLQNAVYVCTVCEAWRPRKGLVRMIRFLTESVGIVVLALDIPAHRTIRNRFEVPSGLLNACGRRI